MRIFYFFRPFVFVFISISAIAQEHNGVWWNKISQTAKVYYLTGFFDGRTEESQLWNLVGKFYYNDSSPELKSAHFNGVSSIVKEQRDKGGNATIEMYMNGISQFYSDYANTTIPLGGAIIVVSRRLNGDNEKEVESAVLSMRKAFSTTN